MFPIGKVAAALCCWLPLVAAAAVEIPEIGLRVESVMFTANPKADPQRSPAGRAFELSKVVAVLQGGPAYDAGIAPGDVIRAVGSTANLRPDIMARFVTQRYRPGQQLGLRVSYEIEGGEREERTIQMTVRAPVAAASWITAVPKHMTRKRGEVPGLPEYRAKRRAQYQDKRREALATLAKRGCQIEVAEVDELGANLKTLAEGAGMGDQGDQAVLRQSRRSACENAAAGVSGGSSGGGGGGSGGLGDFEKALWSMTDARRLDPCSYSPSNDYSQVFADPAYQGFQNPLNYNEGGRARYMVYMNRVEEEQKECFLNVIAARLLGVSQAEVATRRKTAPARPTPAPKEPSTPTTTDAGREAPSKPQANMDTTAINQQNKLFESARMMVILAGEAGALDQIRGQWNEYMKTGAEEPLKRARELKAACLDRLRVKASGSAFLREAYRSVNRLKFIDGQ